MTWWRLGSNPTNDWHQHLKYWSLTWAVMYYFWSGIFKYMLNNLNSNNTFYFYLCIFPTFSLYISDIMAVLPDLSECLGPVLLQSVADNEELVSLFMDDSERVILAGDYFRWLVTCHGLSHWSQRRECLLQWNGNVVNLTKFSHWLHRKWQFMVQPVMKISSISYTWVSVWCDIVGLNTNSNTLLTCHVSSQ